MGFPLHRGTVKEGVLTCHWHHARFDLATGGTFDPWADDVRVYPVEIRSEDIWVDLAPRIDPVAHQRQRLRDGLERNIPLVIAKAVIALLDGDVKPVEPFRIGLEFGVLYRQAGWGQGLTILTCMMSLLPYLDPDDGMRALYHGLAAVARDSAAMPPRFPLRPLPGTLPDMSTLKRWFRQFVEVRDADGAERTLVSAVRAGADHRQIADMLFAAATDHHYIQVGHFLDFTNKALEALDLAGWELAETVLSSLATSYATADRMEESNAWRHPVDLVAILERAFGSVPEALKAGRISPDVARASRPRGTTAKIAVPQGEQGPAPGTSGLGTWTARETLLSVLLGDDPQAIADGLLAALRDGSEPEELGGIVAHAAALRIARFHTSNDFSDWDRALHTFTFANAVHQGLRRVASAELVRGLFDAGMSIYLDRFLNVPAVPLPEPEGSAKNPGELLEELAGQLDRQQRVNEAGSLVARYLYSGASASRLLATLGNVLMREDRDFHTIQTLEAAFRQQSLFSGTPVTIHVLVAAARYLAAHAPTVRSQIQTYQIARRLYRGEHLYEEP